MCATPQHILLFLRGLFIKQRKNNKTDKADKETFDLHEELINKICEESLCAFGDRRIYSQTAAGQDTHPVRTG